MKRIKSMHFFVAITVLLGCAGVFPLSNAAQTIAVIHVFLIIDDGNPTTGYIHNVDKDLMHGLFHEICRLATDCEATELKSSVDEDSPEWMSSGNILK